MTRLFSLCIFLALLCISACTKDKLDPEPDNCAEGITYTKDTKAIIDRTCAYVGCHVAGFVKGNHTSYQTLLPQLQNGSFSKNVIKDREMPPNYVEESRKLTAEEYDLINCWIKDGFPE